MVIDNEVSDQEQELAVQEKLRRMNAIYRWDKVPLPLLNSPTNISSDARRTPIASRRQPMKDENTPAALTRRGGVGWVPSSITQRSSRRKRRLHGVVDFDAWPTISSNLVDPSADDLPRNLAFGMDNDTSTRQPPAVRDSPHAVVDQVPTASVGPAFSESRSGGDFFTSSALDPCLRDGCRSSDKNEVEHDNRGVHVLVRGLRSDDGGDGPIQVQTSVAGKLKDVEHLAGWTEASRTCVSCTQGDGEDESAAGTVTPPPLAASEKGGTRIEQQVLQYVSTGSQSSDGVEKADGSPQETGENSGDTGGEAVVKAGTAVKTFDDPQRRGEKEKRSLRTRTVLEEHTAAVEDKESQITGATSEAVYNEESSAIPAVGHGSTSDSRYPAKTAAADSTSVRRERRRRHRVFIDSDDDEDFGISTKGTGMGASVLLQRETTAGDKVPNATKNERLDAAEAQRHEFRAEAYTNDVDMGTEEPHVSDSRSMAHASGENDLGDDVVAERENSVQIESARQLLWQQMALCHEECLKTGRENSSTSQMCFDRQCESTVGADACGGQHECDLVKRDEYFSGTRSDLAPTEKQLADTAADDDTNKCISIPEQKATGGRMRFGRGVVHLDDQSNVGGGGVKGHVHGDEGRTPKNIVVGKFLLVTPHEIADDVRLENTCDTSDATNVCAHNNAKEPLVSLDDGVPVPLNTIGGYDGECSIGKSALIERERQLLRRQMALSRRNSSVDENKSRAAAENGGALVGLSSDNENKKQGLGSVEHNVGSDRNKDDNTNPAATLVCTGNGRIEASQEVGSPVPRRDVPSDAGNGEQTRAGHIPQRALTPCEGVAEENRNSRLRIATVELGESQSEVSSANTSPPRQTEELCPAIRDSPSQAEGFVSTSNRGSSRGGSTTSQKCIGGPSRHTQDHRRQRKERSNRRHRRQILSDSDDDQYGLGNECAGPLKMTDDAAKVVIRTIERQRSCHGHKPSPEPDSLRQPRRWRGRHVLSDSEDEIAATAVPPLGDAKKRVKTTGDRAIPPKFNGMAHSDSSNKRLDRREKIGTRAATTRIVSLDHCLASCGALSSSGDEGLGIGTGVLRESARIERANTFLRKQMAVCRRGSGDCSAGRLEDDSENVEWSCEGVDGKVAAGGDELLSRDDAKLVHSGGSDANDLPSEFAKKVVESPSVTSERHLNKPEPDETTVDAKRGRIKKGRHPDLSFAKGCEGGRRKETVVSCLYSSETEEEEESYAMPTPSSGNDDSSRQGSDSSDSDWWLDVGNKPRTTRKTPAKTADSSKTKGTTGRAERKAIPALRTPRRGNPHACGVERSLYPETAKGIAPDKAFPIEPRRQKTPRRGREKVGTSSARHPVVPISDGLCGSAFFKARDSLTTQYFNEFNEGAFGGALVDVKVTWSTRLLRTAGVTKSRKDYGSSRRGGNSAGTPAGPAYTSRVELSSKVVDSEAKLKETLLHELCHAAAWVISHKSNPPHGEHFWSWANRAKAAHPGVPVTTCHSYEINYKYRYVCVGNNSASHVDNGTMEGVGCGAEMGRHSKSIDVVRQVCGRCRGRLVLFGTHGKDGKLKKPRAASAFSLFVKEHYAQVKKSMPAGTKQQVVMQEISKLWAVRDKTQGSCLSDISGNKTQHDYSEASSVPDTSSFRAATAGKLRNDGRSEAERKPQGGVKGDCEKENIVIDLC